MIDRETRARLYIFFLPYVVLNLGVVLVYSVLVLCLELRTKLVTFDDDTVQIFIPAIIAAFCVWLTFRKRLRLLAIDRVQSFRGPQNYKFAYYLLGTIAVVAPTALFLQFLEGETANVTSVTSASEIQGLPISRFYVVSDMCFDTQRFVAMERQIVERKGRSFYFHRIFLAPLCMSSSGGMPPAWVPFNYSSPSFPISLSGQEVEARHQEFEADSLKYLRGIEPAWYGYLEQVGRSGERREYESLLKLHGMSSDVILVPRIGSVEVRRAHDLVWVVIALALGLGAWFVLIVVPDLRSPSIDELENQVR